jgi:hypothetical protein
MTHDRYWKWFEGEYRIHCTDPNHFKQIIRWKGCRLGSTYYFPDGRIEWDVTIPEGCLERALSLVAESETSKKQQNRTDRTLNPSGL